jgi:hypothetical protein
LVVRFEQTDERHAIELRFLTRAHEADLKLTEQRGVAKLDAERERSAVWREDAEAGRAWYREPRLWFIVGIVAGVAVAAGATAAATAIVEARR